METENEKGKKSETLKEKLARIKREQDEFDEAINKRLNLGADEGNSFLIDKLLRTKRLQKDKTSSRMTAGLKRLVWFSFFKK